MPKEYKDKTHKIGYGKTPTHTRFKKGQSGNPKGRPKGSKNLATIMREAMREKLVIVEDGERKTFNKLEVAIKQQMNKAAAGDHKAMTLLLPLVQEMELSDAAASALEPHMGQVDHQVMESISARFRRSALAELNNTPGNDAQEVMVKEVKDDSADTQ